MTFTGVTKVHGPSPQPTACRSPKCNRKCPVSKEGLNLLCLRSLGWMGSKVSKKNNAGFEPLESGNGNNCPKVEIISKPLNGV